ncbi:hypothetical protein KAI92_00635 [Candidatus Parcubacteria bacterium]|nr:hypothetical protein [Candidatus Parcubacteria bacterium]
MKIRSLKIKKLDIFKTKKDVILFRKSLEDATRENFEKFDKARKITNMLSRNMVLD